MVLRFFLTGVSTSVSDHMDQIPRRELAAGTGLGTTAFKRVTKAEIASVIQYIIVLGENFRWHTGLQH